MRKDVSVGFSNVGLTSYFKVNNFERDTESTEALSFKSLDNQISHANPFI